MESTNDLPFNGIKVEADSVDIKYIDVEPFLPEDDLNADMCSQVKVKDKVLDTITSSSYITTSTSSQYFQVEVIKQPSQFNPDMENPTQPVSWSTWTSQVKSEDGITVYDKTGLYADTVYIDNLHDVQMSSGDHEIITIMDSNKDFKYPVSLNTYLKDLSPPYSPIMNHSITQLDGAPSPTLSENSSAYTAQSSPTYPAQNSPTYPAQNSPAYPAQNSPAYPVQSSPAYLAQNSPAYPAQNSPAYPAQSSPDYHTQSSSPNPAQTSPAYPPKKSSSNPAQNSPSNRAQISTAYPLQSSPACPAQNYPEFPPQNSPIYPPHSFPSYPPQNSPAYPPLNSPDYPPQNSPVYPPQNSLAYPPHNSPVNPPQNALVSPPEGSPAYSRQSSPDFSEQNSPSYPDEKSLTKKSNSAFTQHSIQSFTEIHSSHNTPSHQTQHNQYKLMNKKELSPMYISIPETCSQSYSFQNVQGSQYFHAFNSPFVYGHQDPSSEVYPGVDAPMDYSTDSRTRYHSENTDLNSVPSPTCYPLVLSPGAKPLGYPGLGPDNMIDSGYSDTSTSWIQRYSEDGKISGHSTSLINQYYPYLEERTSDVASCPVRESSPSDSQSNKTFQFNSNTGFYQGDSFVNSKKDILKTVLNTLGFPSSSSSSPTTPENLIPTTLQNSDPSNPNTSVVDEDGRNNAATKPRARKRKREPSNFTARYREGVQILPEAEKSRWKAKLQKTNQTCRICGDVSSGTHYTCYACEGCKSFFRRAVTKKATFKCRYSNGCNIVFSVRNKCQACRFAKCIAMNMNPQCVREEGRRGKNPKLNPTSDPKTQDEKGSQSSEEPVYTAGKSVAPLKLVNSETKKSTGDLILNAAIRAVADADSGMNDNQRTGEVYQNPTMASRSWLGGNNPEITCKEYEVLIKLVNLYNQLEHPHPTDLDEIDDLIAQEKTDEDRYITEVLETTCLAARLIVQYSKFLPGFIDVDRSDQMTILKGSSSECLILRSARRYNVETDSIVFSNNHAYTTTTWDIVGLDNTELMRFCRNVCSLNMDNAEYALLTAIIVFSDRDNIQFKHKLDRVREKYVKLLKSYIKMDPSKPADKFYKLIDLLPQLRKLNVINQNQTAGFKIRNPKFPPLLAELWGVELLS